MAAKRYQKDSSKMTMRERLAAKARREEMLRNSIAASHKALGITGAGSAAAGGGDADCSGGGGGGGFGTAAAGMAGALQA